MRRRLLLLLLIVLPVLAQTGLVRVQRRATPTYLHYRSLTAAAAQSGSADSANFPVTVTATLGSSRVQNASCYDVIFSTDSAGTSKLPWEMESCDQSTGAIVAHVKVATLSHTSDTVFYVLYDNSGISTAQNTGSYAPTAVWDSSFFGVWHLSASGGGTNADSTSNAHTGTNANLSDVAGQVGRGAGLNGTSSAVALGNSTGYNLGAGDFTVSAWFNTSSSAYQALMGKDVAASRQWNFAVNAAHAGNLEFYDQNDGPAYTPYTGSAWVYGVAVRSGTPSSSLITVFVNGSASGGTTLSQTSFPSNFSTQSNLFIGKREYSGFEQWFNGSIDEVRISNIARSASWILASYNNQKPSSTFLTVGSEI